MKIPGIIRKMKILTLLLAVVGIMLASTVTANEERPSDSKPDSASDDVGDSTAASAAADDDDDDEAVAPKEENDVLVLTKDSFDDVIYGKDTVLVEFYAPWCGHCKQLAPEFEKAAAKLKVAEPPVILGKVDATVETELASRFDVSGYPTLKWFKDGKPFDYDGPREADGIVDYMKAHSDPNWAPPPEAVIVLTKENFTEVTEREDLLIVMFYAPWCGHCKRLHPEYEKAAQQLKKDKDSPVLLAKVDATVEADLATKYSVTGYPTLKIFRRGHVYDYKGDSHDSWGIVSYIEMQKGSASKEISSLDAVKRQLAASGTDGSTVVIVSFFESADKAAFAAYEEATNELREDYKFWHTFDATAHDFYKVKVDSLVVFTAERFQTPHEPKKHVLEIKEGATSTEITEFIRSHDAPLVAEYNRETSEKTYKTRRPLVLFFYTVDWTFEHRDATQAWRKKFAEIAKRFSTMTFAIADEEQNRDLFKEFGFDESSEEVNVGITDERNKKYAMTPQEEYDADEVVSFLKDFMKGNLVPKVKSQPIPKKQDGPVTVVVGETFDKIVLDKKKDVLIELYAPWCGHCKKLEPVYKDLAKKFKKAKNLVIAKMDATANDAPENYPSSGYPTIYFAPANGKQSPIAYSGDGKLDDLVKFVKKHATVALGKSKKDEL